MHSQGRPERARGARRVAGLVALALGLADACSDSAPPPAPPQAEAPASPAPQDGTPAPLSGRFRRVGSSAERQSLPPEQRRQVDELEAVGYASGSTPAPARSGVTRHDARAGAGWNLYTSGHAPVAVLMDMDGVVRHTWQATVESVFPDPQSRGATFGGNKFWRRAHLFDNGDLLAIFEGHSLVKLDKDSHVLWKNRCGAHHDLEVLADGDILVLTREVKVDPRHGEKPILEDSVTRLGPDGSTQASFSLLEALERSPYQELRERALARRGDILHTNSIALLDGRFESRNPAFRRGNLLLSSRPLSFLSIVDPEKRELVWTLQGPFTEQHDPKLLDDGNLLVFDNGGARGSSRVLELDPASGATVWEYHGSPEAPFYTRTCGTAQRLANGDTLITESDGGRAFEVTPAGEIVWEFYNPERAGPEGEYIASLFEVLRLPPAEFAWLK